LTCNTGLETLSFTLRTNTNFPITQLTAALSRACGLLVL
jgi:hypothetical protein